jgi:hypothetical protein
MDLAKVFGTAGVPNAALANSAGTVEIQDKKDSNVMTPSMGAHDNHFCWNHASGCTDIEDNEQP